MTFETYRVQSTGLTLLVFALVAACLGTDDASNLEGKTPIRFRRPDISPDTCVTSAAPRIIPLDSSDALGFSARDILAFSAGHHIAELHWSETENALVPRVLASTLQLDIAMRGKAARLGLPAGIPYNPYSGCFARLELDVTVTVLSGYGAIDGSFDAVLYADRADFAVLRAAVPMDKLASSWRGQHPAGHEQTPPALELELIIGTQGVTGQLWTAWDEQISELPLAGAPDLYAELAYVGPVNCAGGPAFDATIPFNGSTIAERIARLTAHSPAQVTWLDGSVSIVSFDFKPSAYGCIRDEDGGRTRQRAWKLPGTLHMMTADGRFGGALHAELETFVNDPGSAAAEYLEASLSVRDQSPPAPAELGFTKQSGDGYGSVSSWVRISLSRDDYVGGDVQLTGAPPKDPMCTTSVGICYVEPVTLEQGTLH